MADENGGKPRGYVLFVWSPTGYSIRELEGEPPAVGQEVEDGRLEPRSAEILFHESVAWRREVDGDCAVEEALEAIVLSANAPTEILRDVRRHRALGRIKRIRIGMLLPWIRVMQAADRQQYGPFRVGLAYFLEWPDDFVGRLIGRANGRDNQVSARIELG